MKSLICLCPLVHMSKFNKVNENRWQLWDSAKAQILSSPAPLVLLLLRYNQLPMPIQIRFQYRSSMLLVFRYHSNQIAISHLRHIYSMKIYTYILIQLKGGLSFCFQYTFSIKYGSTCPFGPFSTLIYYGIISRFNTKIYKRKSEFTFSKFTFNTKKLVKSNSCMHVTELYFSSMWL